jgi:DNA-binding transcriptional ArsR family regulator
MASTTAPQSTFDGFTSPNYTQVPDELFDLLMPQLADNELRVLLYIVRRTFGFKRDADTISLSQMVHGITTRDGSVLDAGTGLSKSTVARGLKSLREKGIIVATRNASKERGDQPTTYRLRFKTDVSTSEPVTSTPVSHQQDTPRVSSVGQAVSHEWDTQETDEQETAFESSNGETREWDRMEEGAEGDQTVSNPQLTGSSFSEGSLGAILKHRIRRDAGKDERQMIAVAIGRIADELGDQAETKSSISRAMHLYQAADVHIAAFTDLLYRVRGEVLDRYRHPGKAPIPRNKMAYFFAVVEDRLGLKEGREGEAR